MIFTPSRLAAARKNIALAMALCLLWTSGGVAESAAAAPEVFAVPTLPLPFNLTPPGALGRIADYYSSPTPGSKLVILIQDLHAHYGVQKNIAGLLNFLSSRLEAAGSRENQLTSPRASSLEPRASMPFALAVEGAEGPVDSSVMALFPDQKIKQQAADYLMREGELTGAEYFAVMRGIPNLLTGVENGEYYTINRELFRKTLADRQELIGLLKAIQADLQPLEGHLYGPSLKAFQKILAAGDNGSLSRNELLAELLHRSAALQMNWKSDFPELAQFAMSAEALPAPERLRSATADFLSQSQNVFSREEQQTVAALAKRSNSTEYYLYLRDLLFKHQLFLAAPLELSRYLEYVHASTSMDMDHIQYEMQELSFRLELAIAREGSLSSSPAVVSGGSIHGNMDPGLQSAGMTTTTSNSAADLVQVEHDLALLIRVADLQSTEQEVKAFGPRMNQFIALCQTLMTSNGISSFDKTRVSRLISSSIDYYAMALLRNQPMVDNTLRLLQAPGSRLQANSSSKTPRASSLEPGASVAVLITGGFHTEPLTELLRARNVSYIVITPTVESLTDADHDLYIKRLSGDLLTEEDVLASRGKLGAGDSDLAARLDSKHSGLAVGAGIVTVGVALTALYVAAAHGKPLSPIAFAGLLGYLPVSSVRGWLQRMLVHFSDSSPSAGDMEKIALLQRSISTLAHPEQSRRVQKEALRLNQRPYFPDGAPTTEETIKTIQAVLHQSKIPGLSVALYGSYAKRSQNVKSDLDIFVIVPDVSQRAQRQAGKAVIKALREKGYHIEQGPMPEIICSPLDAVMGLQTVRQNDLLSNVIWINGESQESPEMNAGSRKQVTINDKDKGGSTLEDHAQLHAEGQFATVLQKLADEVDTPRVSGRDGWRDLRAMVENRPGQRLSTARGEIRVEADGLLVLTDDRFGTNHAGDNAFAVYAQNPRKARHEAAELRAWIRYALRHGIATPEDVLQGRFGDRLSEWSDAFAHRHSWKFWILRKRFHLNGLFYEFTGLPSRPLQILEQLYNETGYQIADAIHPEIEEGPPSNYFDPTDLARLLEESPRPLQWLQPELYQQIDSFSVPSLRIIPDILQRYVYDFPRLPNWREILPLNFERYPIKTISRGRSRGSETFGFEIEFLIKDQLGIGRDQTLPANQWHPARKAILDQLRSVLPLDWVLQDFGENMIEFHTPIYHNTPEDWNRFQKDMARIQQALPGKFYSLHMHVGREDLSQDGRLNVDAGRFARVVKTFESMWRVLAGRHYSESSGTYVSPLGVDALSDGKSAKDHSRMINLSYRHPTIEFKLMSGLLNTEGHLDLGTLQSDADWAFTLLNTAAEPEERMPLAVLGIPVVAGDKPSQKQIDHFIQLFFGTDAAAAEHARAAFAAVANEPAALAAKPKELYAVRTEIRAAFRSMGLLQVYLLHRAADGWDENIVEHLLEPRTLPLLASDLVSAGHSDETALGFFPVEMHEALREALKAARKGAPQVAPPSIPSLPIPEWIRDSFYSASLDALRLGSDFSSHRSRQEIDESLDGIARYRSQAWDAVKDIRLDLQGFAPHENPFIIQPMSYKNILIPKWLTLRFAFPKTSPYGLTAVLVGAAGIIAAIVLRALQYISGDWMGGLIALSMIAYFHLGAAAMAYRIYLSNIHDGLGPHRDPDFQNASNSQLAERVKDQITAEFGAKRSVGMTVVVVNEMIGIDEAGFSKITADEKAINEFRGGYFYLEEAGRLYVNNNEKDGVHANNALLDFLPDRLYVNANAARADRGALGLVLAHEIGKKVIFSMSLLGSLRFNRRIAELFGNIYEALYFVRFLGNGSAPLNLSVIVGSFFLAALGSTWISLVNGLSFYGGFEKIGSAVPVRIEIPTLWKSLVDGQNTIDLSARTPEEAIENLIQNHPDLERALKDHDGRVRSFIRIFVNDEEEPYMLGSNRELSPNDTLTLVPTVSGSSGKEDDGAAMTSGGSADTPPEANENGIVLRLKNISEDEAVQDFQGDFGEGSNPFPNISYTISIYGPGAKAVDVDAVYGELFRLVQSKSTGPALTIEREIDMDARTIHLIKIGKEDPAFPVHIYEEESKLLRRRFLGFTVESETVNGLGAAKGFRKYYNDVKVLEASPSAKGHTLDQILSEPPSSGHNFAFGIDRLSLRGKVLEPSFGSKEPMESDPTEEAVVSLDQAPGTYQLAETIRDFERSLKQEWSPERVPVVVGQLESLLKNLRLSGLAEEQIQKTIGLGQTLMNSEVSRSDLRIALTNFYANLSDCVEILKEDPRVLSQERLSAASTPDSKAVSRYQRSLDQLKFLKDGETVRLSEDPEGGYERRVVDLEFRTLVQAGKIEYLGDGDWRIVPRKFFSDTEGGAPKRVVLALFVFGVVGGGFYWTGLADGLVVSVAVALVGFLMWYHKRSNANKSSGSKGSGPTALTQNEPDMESSSVVDRRSVLKMGGMTILGLATMGRKAFGDSQPFFNDLNELPPDLMAEYKKQIQALDKRVRSALKNKERLSNEDFLKFVREEMDINEPLMKRGYFVGRNIETKIAANQLLQVPRATLFHIHPIPGKRSLGDREGLLYSVQSISGYTESRSLYGFEAGDVAFVIEKDLQDAAETIKAFRKNYNPAIRISDQLRPFIWFDDPLADEIVLKTFEGIPDDQIYGVLREQTVYHEMTHLANVSVEELPERPADLAEVFLSKSPYFHLLQLVSQMIYEEEMNAHEDHGAAARVIMSDLADALIASGQLTEAEAGSIAHPSQDLTGKDALEFLRLLHSKEISNDDIRTALKSKYDKDYKKLPDLPLIASASPAHTVQKSPAPLVALALSPLRSWLNSMQEMSSPAAAPEVNDVVRLKTLRDAIDENRVGRTANIFDLHGNPEMLDYVIKLVKDGEIDEVIFHGDAFDRGNENFAVFAKLQELHDLLGDKFVLLFGNHDVWMIRALMLGDMKALFDWIWHDDRVFVEAGLEPLSDHLHYFSKQGKDVDVKNMLQDILNDKKIGPIREMARWMLAHQRFHFVDSHGILHVHAGIPLDENGQIKAGFALADLQAADRELQGIQAKLANPKYELSTDEQKTAGKLFKRMRDIFWIKQEDWIYNLMTLEGTYKVVQKRMQAFLDAYGIQGIMFGHNRRLTNIDNRIFGGDLDSNVLIIHDFEGITQRTRKRDKTTSEFKITDDRQISKQQILARIDQEIARKAGAETGPEAGTAGNITIAGPVDEPEPVAESWAKPLHMSARGQLWVGFVALMNGDLGDAWEEWGVARDILFNSGKKSSSDHVYQVAAVELILGKFLKREHDTANVQVSSMENPRRGQAMTIERLYDSRSGKLMAVKVLINPNLSVATLRRGAVREMFHALEPEPHGWWAEMKEEIRVTRYTREFFAQPQNSDLLVSAVLAANHAMVGARLDPAPPLDAADDVFKELWTKIRMRKTRAEEVALAAARLALIENARRSLRAAA